MPNSRHNGGFAVINRSRLLRYPPEVLHPCDDIACSLDARRKLRVKNDLRRTEFFALP